MKNLILEETPDTPKVILDKVNGIFEISGRSLPENAVKFYTPIIQWLEEYTNSPNQTTRFEFKLDYFNSASAKKIVELITVLEKLVQKKYSSVITWYYSKDDDLIKNRGLEMSEMSDVPFEVKTY
jgi:hypothetical protein